MTDRDESGDRTPGTAHEEPSLPFPRIDPVGEVHYWEQAHASEPYFVPGMAWDDYAPAYRIGIAQRLGDPWGLAWNDGAEQLETLWLRRRGYSRLAWEQARDAVSAAWHRIDRVLAKPPDA